MEKTGRYFKRLGGWGFWGQLVCTVVAAVILSFSIVVTGKITSPVTFYATAGGIAAAFVSVFWSFGYLRLSEKLQRTSNEPTKVLMEMLCFWILPQLLGTKSSWLFLERLRKLNKVFNLKIYGMLLDYMLPYKSNKLV